MKILILGSSGMIGHTIFNHLSSLGVYDVFGSKKQKNLKKNVIKLDALNLSNLCKIFEDMSFDLVINCIGLTKHRKEYENTANVILLNSFLPWELKNLSVRYNFRLIQISTDCVFSGQSGFYSEDDFKDANDIYGKSKALGEISDYKNCFTIRTSTIGHELINKNGLLEWFLSQEKCLGYTKAIFSGLPVIVLADIIDKYIIPNVNLFGCYNVVGKPISKYDLLNIVNKQYEKKINLIKDASFVIDRTLNGEKFFKDTGYLPLEWEKLIQIMYEDHF